MKSKNDTETRLSAIGRLPARIESSDLALLNEALAFLFQELGMAAELHRSDANAGRKGIIHSVETTIKFLSLFAPVISSSLHAPLGVLFDALMSLDDGRLLPLLTPKKKAKGGRTPASAIRASLTGVVAFTVKRLTETGLSEHSAQEAVARELKRLGIRPARGRAGTITARTIRGWCEAVSADVGRRGEAAQTFDLLMTDSNTSSGLLPKRAQTVLFDRLAALAKKTRAQEGA